MLLADSNQNTIGFAFGFGFCVIRLTSTISYISVYILLT